MFHLVFSLALKKLQVIIIRLDLHGTVFVSCDKLTTGLRHDLRLPRRFKTCFKMLRHFSDVRTNRKSCRRPVVSLSHETKIVPCKSALTPPMRNKQGIGVGLTGKSNRPLKPSVALVLVCVMPTHFQSNWYD